MTHNRNFLKADKFCILKPQKQSFASGSIETLNLNNFLFLCFTYLVLLEEYICSLTDFTQSIDVYTHLYIFAILKKIYFIFFY